MSDILAIYDAIEGVTVSPVTTVKNLDSLPASPSAAAMPMRLLLPFGAGDNEGNMLEYMDRGSNAFVDWRIIDLLLMRPVGQGEGIHTVAALVVAYAGAYIDTMVQHRYLDDRHQLEITGVTAKPGIVEYPSGGGIYYHGCVCTLTVREALVNP